MYVPLLLRGVPVAAIILVAPCAMAQPGPSGPPAVGVITVERRPMTESFEFTGRIQAINSVNIVARVTAFLEKRLFVEGSDVKKGDLLVRIKPDSYKALLEQQEASISSAKATNLQQRASMQKAEQDFKRAQDLFNKKMISAQEYNAADAAYGVAKNTHESSIHDIERAEALIKAAGDAEGVPRPHRHDH